MSNLTGQQINLTYPGLLNLETSTTGITSSLQQIQDGLGNNTGSKIATNLFTAPNLIQTNIIPLKPQYAGVGMQLVGTTSPGAGSQSNLVWTYFLEWGYLEYSAITYNVTTQTSTSDVVDLYFYDCQWVNDYGVFPRNLIMSAGTLDVSTTGLKTLTLPSTLTFSGGGGGYYIVMLKYTNGGVTPSARFSSAIDVLSNQSLSGTLGYVRTAASAIPSSRGNRASSFTGPQWYWFTNQTTPSTITEADVVSRFNTTFVNGSIFGFALNTIK